ncbi:DMT family transporter [Afipia massiliensis]|uniref:DMT family transporter n=1 Tax=Afipia massiliensis TaxID=211460 RepID=A0A4U6BRM6_9BRAD|nr:DMT family transporter [Afipia massiliensis]TKT71394.1 DMT family transporter [Afipia massiliensis]
MTSPLNPSSGVTPRSSTLSGILFMLAAITIFSLVNVFSKMMVTAYPPAQLFFIRGFAAIATLLPFLARDNFAAVRNVPRPGLQVLRMALSVADGMLFFTAIKYIPLADATTCYLAAPIFVTAFSAIFLREHVGWRRWTAVVVGFIGVLIALRPTGAAISWPALIALAGCLCQSVFMIVTRYVRGTSNFFLAMTQVVGSFVFGGIVSAFIFLPPTWLIVGLLLVSGTVNVVAVLCLNRSLILAPASVVAPFQYTMIVWAIVLGFLAFGDVPSPNTMIGAAIVASAGIYIFLRERKVMHREPEPNPPTVV